MDKCSVEECMGNVVARGYCNKHWQRWRKYGQVNVIAKKPLPKQCEVPGCDRKPHARWDGKALCNMHYLRIWQYGSTDERERSYKTWHMCSVQGCDKPARSSGEGAFCEMHYYRFRRTGSVEIIKRGKFKSNHSAGYILLFDKNHPLALGDSGSLYEHRKVLFDEIGWGPHKCYWCGSEIDWAPGERNKIGSLVVDHFNGDKKDNNVSNLLASCHRCNCLRGLFQRWIREHGEDAMMLIRDWSKKDPL